MNIRIVNIFLVAATLLAACSSGTTTERKNIALIDQYIQAVENLDYQTMEVLLDEDYLCLGPSYGDSIRKTEAVENWKWLVDNLYNGITYNRKRSMAVSAWAQQCCSHRVLFIRS